MKDSIKVIPFPEIENAYIVISGWKDDEKANGVRLAFTFMYANEKTGCEWQPEHGAITRLTPCDKDHPDARPHFFYDYYTGQGDWTQLSVDEERLPYHFYHGNYRIIFNVLKRYSGEYDE